MFQHQGWGDAIIVGSQPDLLSDSWHHLFVTYDGSSKASGVQCYFDGSLQKTRAMIDSLSGTIHNDSPLQIGGRNGPNHPLTGAIDDVRIYNRQLSEKEVGQLFASGAVSLAGTISESRTSEQQNTLNRVYRPQDDTSIRLNSQLAATKKLLNDARWNGIRRWYVNSQGQTMVVIPNPAESSP